MINGIEIPQRIEKYRRKTDEVIPAQKITAENPYIFRYKIIQLL
jgi:hypothetical protein